MKGLAAAVIASLVAVAIALAAPVAADVTDVSGSGAFGVSANATVLGVPAVQVGPVPSVNLPAGGGSVDEQLASVNAPNVVEAGLLEVESEGGDLGSHQGFAISSASVADVTVLELLDDLLGGDPLLEADVVTAECESNGDGSSGESTLVDAAVAGNAVAVNPPPNTTIDLLNGTVRVVLNEQLVTNTPGVETTITVNAVHVTANVAGLVNADIIVSQARCRAAGPDVLGGPPPGGPGGPGGPDGPGGPGGPGAGGPGGSGPGGPAAARPVTGSPSRLTG